MSDRVIEIEGLEVHALEQSGAEPPQDDEAVVVVIEAARGSDDRDEVLRELREQANGLRQAARRGRSERHASLARSIDEVIAAIRDHDPLRAEQAARTFQRKARG